LSIHQIFYKLAKKIINVEKLTHQNVRPKSIKKIDPQTSSLTMSDTGKTIISDISDDLLKCPTGFSDRFVYSNSFIPLRITFDNTTPPPVGDDLTPLFKSEVGYLFLDRTRIRPKGFAIGEHVYSLSLAPQEEVILEQKNFSKRQITYEEENQQERQFDIELSSTLSTEIQEGLQLQKNLSNTTGFTVGGGASGEVKGVPVNASINYSNNTSEANNETKTRSVKESSNTSSKVASKYRTFHKTTFKISTEVGFETTSKRTIKNPNKCTPIQLHFFKILQRLDMNQERYGVRLAWTPVMKDPGFDFYERIKKGREEIINKELQKVEIPPRPELVVSGQPKEFETSPPVDTSAKWGAMCDMSADFDVPIQIGNGFIWNNDSEYVINSVELIANNVSRGHVASVLGRPWEEGNTVKLRVHVGVDWKSPFGGCGKLYIKARAIGVPTPSPAEYEEWRGKMNEWQQTVNNLTQEAKEKGQRNADAWEQDVIRRLNPIEEITQRIVNQYFPFDIRNENWEIDLWREIFDWDSASYLIYPGWWSDLPMRDYTKDTTYFINASWAKLYLPVKLGYERIALRWIFGKSISPLNPPKEAIFTKIVQDIETFRTTNFGSKETNIINEGNNLDGGELKEKFITLGRWTEMLPTDGTHTEVIQSITNACDYYTKDEIEDANLRRTGLIESQNLENQIKSKISSMLKIPIDTKLNINIDGNENETSS